MDLTTRTLASDHLTPVRAYAALRAQSVGLSSFLLEFRRPGDPWARYSVLGYLARSEGLYPSGGDAIQLLADDIPAASPGQALAARFVEARVGYLEYDAVHGTRNVEPWPDEAVLCARFIHDATVVVFDHHEHTLTIAGRSPNVVNRCAWEMVRGPELAALRMPDPAGEPEGLDVAVDDAAFCAAATRARACLAAGEVERLHLARPFRVPQGEVDPFDVYRALRVLAPQSDLYFFDFAERHVAQGGRPFAEALCLAGASSETLFHAGAAEGDGPSLDAAALRAVFPSDTLAGSPTRRATQLIRDLEPTSRGLFGGAVGYVLPGGEAHLASADRVVTAFRSRLDVTAGTLVLPETAPELVARASRDVARTALAAIRAGQDAAAARTAAAEAKRAAEARLAAERDARP